MADIYRNSVVTIVADGAEGGHGGRFVGGMDRSARGLSFDTHAETGLAGKSRESSVRIRQQRVRGNWFEVAH